MAGLELRLKLLQRKIETWRVGRGYLCFSDCGRDCPFSSFVRPVNREITLSVSTAQQLASCTSRPRGSSTLLQSPRLPPRYDRTNSSYVSREVLPDFPNPRIAAFRIDHADTTRCWGTASGALGPVICRKPISLPVRVSTRTHGADIPTRLHY